MTTILVADDQADLRRLVRILLTRATGWEVVEAVDGEHALRVAAEHELTAAVLDQRMPHRTGLAVAEELRTRGFSGPVVVFSAYLEPEAVAAARRLEVIAVAKAEIANLAGIIRDALAHG